MISERTLKRWRKDALRAEYNIDTVISLAHAKEKDERILRLTQELMDLHLIQKGR